MSDNTDKVREQHKFQIHLGGIIDLLSNHLYSSPSVYIRELLQNGIDAISARKSLEPAHEGRITIRVGRLDCGRPLLVFQDNGVGLLEEEIHRFIATIGASSKRDVAQRRSSFLGQFGIGLLSAFVVSEEIRLITRSCLADAPTLEWKGYADGTYELMVRENEIEPGTSVYLIAKDGAHDWFSGSKVRDLARRFGELLDCPIEVEADGRLERVNPDPAPWNVEFQTDALRRQAYLSFGKRIFGVDFFDCVELSSEVGKLDGIAYILPYSPNPAAKRAHRVYLRGMLLTEASENLLPPWAFFVTCVVNTEELRPTASRESFYENEMLHRTREDLGNCLRNYLAHLRTSDPRKMQALIAIHNRAIKALAVHDEEFLAMVVDILPFETSFGRITFGEFRARATGQIRYAPTVDIFRQISQVAAAQNVGVINAGYSYDGDLMEKLPQVFPDIHVERIDSTDLAKTFEDLAEDDEVKVMDFVAVASAALQGFRCEAEMRRFTPADIPVLYLAGEDVSFARNVERTKSQSSAHWSAILDQMDDHKESHAILCFNFANPLVRKLARLDDPELATLAIQMLYVQALLLGHHPLSADEMALLNTGLLDLIEHGIQSHSFLDYKQ